MKKDTKVKKTTDNYKKDIKKKNNSNGKSKTSISDTLRSEASIRIMGTFFVLLSVFLLFSFVSFFISWTFDYSEVSAASAFDLFKGDIDIKNWGGAIGAFLSFILIVKTFGIASFGYIFISALIGIKLFGIKIKDFGKTILYTFIIMLWLSAITGYIIYFANLDNYFELAGVVGYSINIWLHGFSGTAGASLILLFFTIALPMIMFGIRYRFLGRVLRKIGKQINKPSKPQTSKAKKVKESKKKEKIEEKEKVEERVEAVIDNPDNDGLTQEEKEKLLEFKVKSKEDTKDKTKKTEVKDVDFEVSTTSIIETEDEKSEGLEETKEVQRNNINTQYDPRADLPSFIFPSTDFLINYEERNKEVEQDELVANKDKIVNTLKNYNIDISKIVATPGPTVTLYEIVPAPGIRISKIKNLEDDIALSLSALGIRIIAPIPGRGTIGIEVPNQHPQIVSMRSMLTSKEFRESKFELPIAIGKTISNKPYVTDLTKMPHLLLAGATGQGKSVGLNAIIASLLYKKHPAELKFVMVDPKKVELSLYTKIERHYLAKLPDTDEAIITDTRKVVRTINSLCIEMDQRYDLLKDAQVRNIKEYNPRFCSRRLNPEKGHRFLPYIVLVIDEFADLIMTAGKEIEMPIARLAQLARAVGIHLIIATQRPSVNIITGIIKANFPARVAFRVTSKIDSRTILDTGGADQLIGRGDMLISTGNEIIRLQCALVDTEEIEKIAEFIGNQRGYPETFLLPEYIDETSEPSKDFDPLQVDDKFEEAARLIVSLQHGSTSIIQRKLSLGYNRAGRIIDQLEAAGIVGQFEGSKAREVRVKTEAELEGILKEYLGR